MVACHKGGIETYLDANCVYKTYQLKNKEVPAVINANLKIKSGEMVSLVGESGSGKSTLANCLSGVLHADDGEIKFREKKSMETGLPECWEVCKLFFKIHSLLQAIV